MTIPKAVVNSMYRMYQEGKSYTEIALAHNKPKEYRSNIHHIFRRNGLKLKSTSYETGTEIPKVVMFQGMKYALAHRSYINTKNRRTLLRDVWEYHFGTIPKGAYIRRIKMNLLDNSVENMECVLKDRTIYRPKKIRS